MGFSDIVFFLAIFLGNAFSSARQFAHAKKRDRKPQQKVEGKKRENAFLLLSFVVGKGWRREGFFRCSLLSAIAEGKNLFKAYFFGKGKRGPAKKNQACKSSLLLHITQVISNLIFLSSLSHTQPDAQKYYICLGKVKLYLKSIYSVFKKMDKVWTLGWAPRADNIGPLVGQSTYPFPILIYILVSCFPPPLPSSFPSTEYKQEEEGMWG